MKNIISYELSMLSIIFYSLTILIVKNYAEADEIDDFINAQMVERKIPGLQLAIVKDHKIVKLGSYGIANLQNDIPVNDTSLFTINSITKAFVGVAIMQLVELGKIDLSDSPSKYVSDLPQAWSEVNIKHLLSHTSGLPEIMNYDGRLVSKEGEDASWLLIKTLPLIFKPNTQFQYNNTNYLLLGK